VSAPATEEARARVAEVLAGIEHAFEPQTDRMVCLRLDAAVLKDALRRLRDAGGFESVTLVTAIDHYPQTPRFEVVHQLRSLAHGDRVRVLTPFDAEYPRCPTCVDLWPGAAYMERECFDLFGVVFEGHVALKRLLMPDGYEYHPLRKEFPHLGIEPDRLYRQWDAKRRAEYLEEA
jgi:NADH-quinone oxidoreductase subunit C